MKKFLSLILVAVLSLCLFTACNPDAEEIDWINIKLGYLLPEPQSNLMEIHSNDDDYLWIYVHNITENNYWEYQRWCEEDMGFNIDTDSDETSFDAYNEDGYHLYLDYNDDKKILDITLDEPIPMEEFKFPEYAISIGLPVPTSNIGYFEWEDEEGFLLYVGETTEDDYILYKDACIDAGFTEDAYDYEIDYSAANRNGDEISLEYEGYNTFSLRFYFSTKNNTNNTPLDYTNAESFESDLNNGVKVEGKTVKFVVNDYKPSSALGINCWAGEHLNFISEIELDVKSGDIIVGRVTTEPTKVLGSWKIPYEVLSIDSNSTNEDADNETEEVAGIVMTLDSSAYAYKKREDVEKEFKNLGFTNILIHEVETTDTSKPDGEVTSVSALNDSFSKGDTFDKNDEIIIYCWKVVKPDTTQIVFPQPTSKLGKDLDTEGTTTVYYINTDGISNTPTLTTWESATVTDGVAEYLNYLKELGFTVSITNTTSKEPYSGYHLYETNFKVSNASVSWTMYLCIQDELFVEYELDIHLD